MDRYDAAAKGFAGKELTEEEKGLVKKLADELLVRRTARLGISVEEYKRALEEYKAN